MDKLESDSFSHMTERNDRRFDTLGRVFSHTVIDYMNGFPQAQSTALDIGSFNGEITREIERKANETLRAHNKRLNIIGLDPLYEQPNGLPASVLAENKGSHAYISGLGEQLPFRDGSIPIVLAIDSIHHSDYPFDVIREMWRVTAAGGMIVIKDHDPDNIIRLLQAGISDVIGNTTKRSEQLTQIRTIIRTIWKQKSPNALMAKYDPSQNGNGARGESDLSLRGSTFGDTKLAFNYLSPSDWKSIFAELSATAEIVKHPFVYDYILRNSQILGWFDQKNCLWVIRKSIIAPEERKNIYT